MSKKNNTPSPSTIVEIIFFLIGIIFCVVVIVISVKGIIALQHKIDMLPTDGPSVDRSISIFR